MILNKQYKILNIIKLLLISFKFDFKFLNFILKLKQITIIYLIYKLYIFFINLSIDINKIIN